MKSIVLGDKNSVLLFALEGVEGKEVTTAAEAIDEVRRIRKSRSYGLLIVTQQVADWASEVINPLRFSKELPLVIDIPGSIGEIDTGKNLADYIREAVGIRI